MASMGAVYGPQGGTPRIFNYNAASAATFITGAVLVFAAGEVVEAGVNPAAGTIVGVAAAPAGGAPGSNMANQPAVITWRDRKCPVYLANGNIFKANLVNGSSVIIAPVATDIGASYGLSAFGGVWYVDQSKTAGTARVVVDKADFDTNEVYFRIIEAFATEI